MFFGYFRGSRNFLHKWKFNNEILFH